MECAKRSLLWDPYEGTSLEVDRRADVQAVPNEILIIEYKWEGVDKERCLHKKFKRVRRQRILDLSIPFVCSNYPISNVYTEDGYKRQLTVTHRYYPTKDYYLHLAIHNKEKTPFFYAFVV